MRRAGPDRGELGKERGVESEAISMARIHAAIERLKAEGIDDPLPEEVADMVAQMQREAAEAERRAQAAD